MFKLRMVPLLVVALAALGQATVRGDFEAYKPPESSITESMKLFLDSGNTPTTGHVGSQTSSLIVDITSTATGNAKEGWAQIDNISGGGDLTSVTFTPRDGNLFVDFSTRGSIQAEGDVTITVVDNHSQSFSFTEKKNADWDRIGVIAVLGSGEYIKSVTVSTDVAGGFNYLKQIAFSQLSDHVVPEPSSMAIAGLGALGFVGFGLRRRVKK